MTGKRFGGAADTLVAFVALAALALAGGCRTRADAGAGAPIDAGAAALAPSSADAGSCACGAAEYCAYAPQLCGKGKRPGACRAKPAACHDPYAPVCACDKKVYPSECSAHAAGVDLDVTGGCQERVRDFVACGPRFCDARTSYCEIVLSDVFELPSDYTCKPLPTACLPKNGVMASCDCFPKGTRCATFCGPIENEGVGGFHLTCRL